MSRRYYYGKTRLAGNRGGKGWKRFFRKGTRAASKTRFSGLKAMGRVFLKAAPAASVAWILFFGAVLLIDQVRSSGFFKVQEVRASGFDNIGEEKMLSRVGPSLGENLVWLDLSSLEERFRQDPWVKTVSFHKSFPDRLVVQVEERRPAAVVSDPAEAVVVDLEGNILEGWSRNDRVPEAWKDLPVILGIRVHSLRSEETGEKNKVQAVYAVLRAAPFFGEPGLTLAVDPSGEVRVQRRDYWLRFGSGEIVEKWRRFTGLEYRLEALNRPIREVDLRFPGKVIVR